MDTWRANLLLGEQTFQMSYDPSQFFNITVPPMLTVPTEKHDSALGSMFEGKIGSMKNVLPTKCALLGISNVSLEDLFTVGL